MVSFMLHVALLPVERPRYPIKMSLGGPQTYLDNGEEKSVAPAGSLTTITGVVHLVAW
jgi:hypothetical protein